MQPAPLPLARARHWGYHAACHGMPDDYHRQALEYAASYACLYADPVFRERLLFCGYAVFWVRYLHILRARHMNWALEQNGNDLGRARLTNLAKRSMDAVLERLKQLKNEGIGLQLVDSSFARPQSPTAPAGPPIAPAGPPTAPTAPTGILCLPGAGPSPTPLFSERRAVEANCPFRFFASPVAGGANAAFLSSELSLRNPLTCNCRLRVTQKTRLALPPTLILSSPAPIRRAPSLSPWSSSTPSPNRPAATPPASSASRKRPWPLAPAGSCSTREPSATAPAASPNSLNPCPAARTSDRPHSWPAGSYEKPIIDPEWNQRYRLAAGSSANGVCRSIHSRAPTLQSQHGPSLAGRLPSACSTSPTFSPQLLSDPQGRAWWVTRVADFFSGFEIKKLE